MPVQVHRSRIEFRTAVSQREGGGCSWQRVMHLLSLPLRPSRCATQCWHAGERASGGAASSLDAGTAAAQPSCLLSAGDEGALEQREVAQWQQLDRLRVTDHTTAVLTASRPGRSAQPDDDDDAGGASGEH